MLDMKLSPFGSDYLLRVSMNVQPSIFLPTQVSHVRTLSTLLKINPVPLTLAMLYMVHIRQVRK